MKVLYSPIQMSFFNLRKGTIHLPKATASLQHWVFYSSVNSASRRRRGGPCKYQYSKTRKNHYMHQHMLILHHNLFLSTHHSLCFLNFAGRGIYILYEDVKSCPYEDVHVLWSILVESHTHTLPALPAPKAWRLYMSDSQLPRIYSIYTRILYSVFNVKRCSPTFLVLNLPVDVMHWSMAFIYIGVFVLFPIYVPHT